MDLYEVIPCITRDTSSLSLYNIVIIVIKSPSLLVIVPFIASRLTELSLCLISLKNSLLLCRLGCRGYGGRCGGEIASGDGERIWGG
jgi:hypothetical protein